MMNDYLKHEWVTVMAHSLQLLHPTVDKDRIETFVTKLYDNQFQDHVVKIYNSYENSEAKLTLNQVLNWIQKSKPLITESGVFFYPKDKKRNVNAEIIKEGMLDLRDIHKKEKFEAKKAGDTFKEAVKQKQQLNDKKAANSGYGAEGQSSSFLYNMHSAMSVTASGRGQISTACQCFDNLLSDNVKFFNMDEFFTWVDHIINEQPEWKFNTYKCIDRIPSKKQFVKRFTNKFLHYSLYDKSMIEKVYDSLSEELMLRVYYKTNLREFLLNRKIANMFRKIAREDVEFINPNEIPEVLANRVVKLSDVLVEFINYRYSVFRYEDRTKYQKRANVVVMDTDSTMVYFGDIYRYIVTNIMGIQLYLTKEEQDNFTARILNTLSYFTTASIKQTLYNYTSNVNIAEADKKFIKMKNEYYYKRMLITFAKKSYIGLMARQESHIFTEPELDVKGVNFFKSTASEATTKFIYDEILMNQLLVPKDDKVSLKRTYKKIYEFQRQIADKIKDGDMGFLKRGIRVKSKDAYAKPLSIGQYKAVYVWNKINSDKDRIELPSTVTIVKVNLKTRQDVGKLAPWTDVYEKVMDLFNNDPAIGDYWDIDKITKEKKLVKGKGIKAIALPNEYDEVPEWILEVIDVETLVADNMNLFAQLYRPLGMSKGDSTHNGSSVSYYTNIVRI